MQTVEEFVEGLDSFIMQELWQIAASINGEQGTSGGAWCQDRRGKGQPLGPRENRSHGKRGTRLIWSLGRPWNPLSLAWHVPFSPTKFWVTVLSYKDFILTVNRHKSPCVELVNLLGTNEILSRRGLIADSFSLNIWEFW